MRIFETGATRDSEEGKYDYEGFLSPLVMVRFAEYMHQHRKQSDGNLRDSDNWQKGIPQEQYMKSSFRHFMDMWMMHRGSQLSEATMEDTLCALMFNIQGYLFEELRKVKAAPAEEGLGLVDHWKEKVGPSKVYGETSSDGDEEFFKVNLKSSPEMFTDEAKEEIHRTLEQHQRSREIVKMGVEEFAKQYQGSYDVPEANVPLPPSNRCRCCGHENGEHAGWCGERNEP